MAAENKRRKDGSPEPFAKWLGELIASARTKRGLSRADLMQKVLRVLYERNLDENDKLWKMVCSHDFLKRLELGRVVKIPRELVNALCQALDVTPQERDTFLLYADRNVLTNGTETPTSAQKLFNQVMADRFREVNEILASLLESSQPLTMRDMGELVDDALKLGRQVREGLEANEQDWGHGPITAKEGHHEIQKP